MVTEYPDNPQERSYSFPATVMIKRITVKDINAQNHETSYEANICYLIPDKTSEQSILFLDAWLPDPLEKTLPEFAMVLGPPIKGKSKGTIERANGNCAEHHIVVMSTGVEEDLNRYRQNGKRINVKVLSCLDEGEADFAKDTSREIHGSEG